jgi:hypothetical protein
MVGSLQIPLRLGGRFAGNGIFFVNEDGNCIRLRTDIEADAAAGAAGSAVYSRIITLAVQCISLSQDFGWTCSNAKGAPFA